MPSKRTAFVTGGLGCIGTAIARQLHDHGHHVLVGYYPAEDFQSWQTAQSADGYDFKCYAVDVADNDSTRTCVEKIHADDHHIDILVNSAGITRDATLRKMSLAQWQDVLRTNLGSMFNMTQPLLDPMLDKGWGRVINISSVNGSKGAFGQTNYSAAKSGIYGFTKALALETARKGITVNAVSPGYIDSPMVAEVPQETLEKHILTEIPMGRLGKPQEIAAMVGFLASDEAAFITGANMPVNGGQHLY
ncbi:MAG TPA: acetoacetyl-CoA reductase [Paenalcaligenes sp.]|nr:acetoacetyl-CoA reductase [Paenalcaligenes sp.]